MGVGLTEGDIRRTTEIVRQLSRCNSAVRAAVVECEASRTGIALHRARERFGTVSELAISSEKN